MFWVGKPECKRRLGKPRHMWVDNIMIELGEKVLGGMELVGLTQDTDKWRALVNEVMNLGAP
jgi:hypothetical protein